MDNRNKSKICNSEVNRLAVLFAQTKCQWIFKDLCTYITPMIQHEAWKASQKMGKDILYSKEDLAQIIHEAVWDAVRGKALLNFNGTSEVMQRIHEFVKNALIDVDRGRKAKKRSGKCEHLDNVAFINENGAVTYGDLLSVEESFESDVIEELEVDEIIAGFSGSGKNHQLIIRMVYDGSSMVNVARELGSQAYDSRSRKQVQRAKDAFRPYLAK